MAFEALAGSGEREGGAFAQGDTSACTCLSRGRRSYTSVGGRSRTIERLDSDLPTGTSF